MAFVRISLMTPKSGQDARVTELLEQLVKFYQGRPGFIDAYRLEPDPHSGTRQQGRISVWENEEAAHRTASETLDMALQSQIKELVEDQSHQEHSFTGTHIGA